MKMRYIGVTIVAAGLLVAWQSGDELTSSGFTEKELDQIFAEGAFPDRKSNPKALANAVVNKRIDRRQEVAQRLNIDTNKQILFGDTHVHTTYSADAFYFSLPIMHGSRGAFPPADACDYARYVSQLDFYFLTDHAKNLSPQQWRDSIESVRHCNEIAGDPENQDLVAFIGFEWTQVGRTAEDHFGHHNVLFRDYGIDQVPLRPIAAVNLRKLDTYSRRGKPLPGVLPLLDFGNRSYYKEFNQAVKSAAELPECDPELNTTKLPVDCFEAVATPEDLYRKLDEWGFDTMAIPHGMSWGRSAPPGATWDQVVDAGQIYNDRTPILEVYSGHGNSEQYRDFSARPLNEAGRPYCPEPKGDYLPRCWQAGEIILQRCIDDGVAIDECQQRAAQARQNFVKTPTQFGWLTVAGTEPDDWLDAGQAREMFMPAFNYRPLKSAQYGLAKRNFDDPENPQGFRWGFVGSTDTHTARAGHGFKQADRLASTDMTGPDNGFWETLLYRKKRDASSHPVEVTGELARSLGAAARDNERLTSFISLGGIAAVHSKGRSREAIWEALKRKEVYGTSGPRMLLWFDLLEGDKTIPMGGETESLDNPRFRVSAVGSFKQLPGCPDYIKAELSGKNLQRLGGGECYHPADERHLISRIEVIRVRPQNSPEEHPRDLIEDVWKSFECPADPIGCTVEFSDEEFALAARDAVYYVRAIQEPMPTVNGANLRTHFDESGKPVAIDPCHGSHKTPMDDQCISNAEHRAWSSPIYVDFAGRATAVH